MALPKREMVFDRTLGRVRPLAGTPVLSSAQLDWRGYLLEQHHLSSLDSRDVVWLNTVVSVHLNRPTPLDWKDGSRQMTVRLLPGQVSVLPTQTVTSARTDHELQALTLSLDGTFIGLACGPGELEKVELQVRIGHEDRFIEGLCLALRSEAERSGDSGRLYSEALASSLAVHLVTKYSVKPVALEAPRDGLSLRAVRQALEMIHDRLGEDVSLRELAAAVGLSPFHFVRLFKRRVGVPPHQYLLRQRIERGKHLLLRGEMNISAIAVAVGFYDQSHFALHFKKLTGTTPKRFAQQGRGGRALPPEPEPPN